MSYNCVRHTLAQGGDFSAATQEDFLLSTAVSWPSGRGHGLIIRITVTGNRFGDRLLFCDRRAIKFQPVSILKAVIAMGLRMDRPGLHPGAQVLEHVSRLLLAI